MGFLKDFAASAAEATADVYGAKVASNIEEKRLSRLAKLGHQQTLGRLTHEAGIAKDVVTSERGYKADEWEDILGKDPTTGQEIVVQQRSKTTGEVREMGLAGTFAQQAGATERLGEQLNAQAKEGLANRVNQVTLQDLGDTAAMGRLQSELVARAQADDKKITHTAAMKQVDVAMQDVRLAADLTKFERGMTFDAWRTAVQEKGMMDRLMQADQGQMERLVTNWEKKGELSEQEAEQAITFMHRQFQSRSREKQADVRRETYLIGARGEEARETQGQRLDQDTAERALDRAAAATGAKLNNDTRREIAQMGNDARKVMQTERIDSELKMSLILGDRRFAQSAQLQRMQDAALSDRQEDRNVFELTRQQKTQENRLMQSAFERGMAEEDMVIRTIQVPMQAPDPITGDMVTTVVPMSIKETKDGKSVSRIWFENKWIDPNATDVSGSARREGLLGEAANLTGQPESFDDAIEMVMNFNRERGRTISREDAQALVRRRFPDL